MAGQGRAGQRETYSRHLARVLTNDDDDDDDDGDDDNDNDNGDMTIQGRGRRTATDGRLHVGRSVERTNETSGRYCTVHTTHLGGAADEHFCEELLLVEAGEENLGLRVDRQPRQGLLN